MELNQSQPMPIPNANKSVWDLVIADMHERDRVGRHRYGTPLQANNSRDALIDAYQEALDLCVYLRQAYIFGRQLKSESLKNACGVEDQVKTQMTISQNRVAIVAVLEFLMGLLFDDRVHKEAAFSPCRKYRYSLSRRWAELRDGGDELVFIGLNPSTADESVDDPTIRRCIGYAKRWGYKSLLVLNIFAYRSTDPKKLLDLDDPIGPENDETLRLASVMVRQSGGRIVLGWGNHGVYRNRHNEVLQLLKGMNLYCWGITSIGMPEHPLYLAKAREPVLFQGLV